MAWQESPIPPAAPRAAGPARRGAARTPSWLRQPEDDEQWLAAPSAVIPVTAAGPAEPAEPATPRAGASDGAAGGSHRPVLHPEWSPSSRPTSSPPVGGQFTILPDGDPAAAAALVRPYARTGGRTRPVRYLDLEALVHTSANGRDALGSPQLSPEHVTVIQLARGTVSVAEIAARISVPLGVARVIIADMVDLGLVEVMKTSAAEGDERDPAFLRRVLSGLQRL